MTVLFALMILGEPFTIFHLIGAIIIIFSIIMIMKPKEGKIKRKRDFFLNITRTYKKFDDG